MRLNYDDIHKFMREVLCYTRLQVSGLLKSQFRIPFLDLDLLYDLILNTVLELGIHYTLILIQFQNYKLTTF